MINNIEQDDHDSSLIDFLSTISDESDKLNELKNKLSELTNSDQNYEIKSILMNKINFYSDECIKEITKNFNNLARKGDIVPIVSEFDYSEISIKNWSMHMKYLCETVYGLSTNNFVSVVSSLLELLKDLNIKTVKSSFHKTTFISLCLNPVETDNPIVMLFALRIKINENIKKLFIFDSHVKHLEISMCMFIAHVNDTIVE